MSGPRWYRVATVAVTLALAACAASDAGDGGERAADRRPSPGDRCADTDAGCAATADAGGPDRVSRDVRGDRGGGVEDGCARLSCEAIGALCGLVEDGCGGRLNCGTCATPLQCIDRACQLPCQGDPECDDADPCTADSCAAGFCSHLEVPGCVRPECLIDLDCDDANACTEDRCDGAPQSCRHEPAGPWTTCDDGDPETVNDTCVDGQCHGEAPPVACRTQEDCDDGNPCTVDRCPAYLQTCRNDAVPSGTACDDGRPDTANDTCVEGLCRGEILPFTCRGPADCDDANPCTDDRCDDGACGHWQIQSCGPDCLGDEQCDDQDPCTADRCETNHCYYYALAGCGGDCERDQDCDDGNPCTLERCQEYACVGELAAAGADCDDGDPATPAAFCWGTLCIGMGEHCATDLECERGPCLVDRCAGRVCEHLPNANGCPPEQCQIDAHCDDANPCTDDTCRVDALTCKHSPASQWQRCDDGDPLTERTICVDGQCVPQG